MIRSLLFGIILWSSLFCYGLTASGDVPEPANKPSDSLNVKIGSVKVGFENRYKNGLWTPITIESAQPIKTLAIRCSDSDGIPMTYRYGNHHEEGRSLSVLGPLKRTIEKTTFLARLGRKNEPIQVAVNGREFQTFSVPPPVNPERPLYLIFGNENIGMQEVIAELALREERRPLLVKINSMKDLPDDWFGYESVDMVILTTTEPKLFGGLSSTSPKIRALHDWLTLGGKILFCAGKDSEPFLEANGCLRDFLPAEFAEMTELRTGMPLELFTNSQRQITMDGTDDTPFMKMPRFADGSEGIIFVKDGDLPIVLRRTIGLGTLIYFGGDLSEKPIANWRDRTALVRNIMQWNTEKRGGNLPRAGAMLQLGYNDMMGQIRSALDRFDHVRIIPFSVILIILVAYWLTIGLFDWFLVHKVLKRPILTWGTFPLWMVLFSILAYALTTQEKPVNHADSDAQTGKEFYRNDLILYDADDIAVRRVSHWHSVYSSGNRRYDFDKGIFYRASGYFSWNGLPGSGLGGMAPKTVSSPAGQTGSVQNSYDELADVPIQTRSTKSFFGQYEVPLPLGTFYLGDRVAVQLSDEEGVPVGTIGIPKGFRFSMKNVLLVYGRWAIELEDILPEQTVTITKSTPRRDVRELLIPQESRDDIRLRHWATYNPQSRDLEYIVRVMSLHKALGGYESTGLHHAYMPSLDMSELLSADRGILLGTITHNRDHPDESEWIKNATHTTKMFRQSLPVTLTESSLRLRREETEEKQGELDSDDLRPSLINNPSGGRE